MRKEDVELFELILLADSGDEKNKWKLVWKFNDLIVKKAKINGRFNEECQEYIENALFNSIDKFKTLEKIKKIKKFS